MDITKKGYRLPTEAEWEFAARGGDTSAAAWNYPFSGHATQAGKTYDDYNNSGLDSVGWYCDNSDNKSHAVGSKGQNSCNSLGIYDMSGNVCEWCYDRFDSISTGSETNPYGTDQPTNCARRVRRGGGWSECAGGTDPHNCFVFSRNRVGHDGRDPITGFRVVRSAQ